MEPATVILGSGMAAYGAGDRLDRAGVDYVCYDQAAQFGGHTASYAYPDGFIFDDGPHLSFTKDPRIQDILAANVDGRFESVQVRIDNYWQGIRIPHPAQVNLHGLPPELIVSIVVDFVAAQERRETEIRDYEAWCRAAYGDTFAETFPMVYGLKYHTVSASELTTDWLGPRFYRPTLEELLRGALLPTPKTDIHYVTHFRYPTYGGFASYLRPWAERTDLRLGHRLVGLEPSERRLRFANGREASYDRLITSVPLPDLVRCIEGAPDDVRGAADRLSFTSVVIVDLGVGRADLSASHITYFYDTDVIFPRLNFPHMLSPNVVPSGAGSIQAEVYFSDRYRPLEEPIEAIADRVEADLRRVGILADHDPILFRQARLVRYANVIYDHARAAALDTVHGYLDDVGIRYCGRYGDWDHAWTDESFISGERAAEAALD